MWRSGSSDSESRVMRAPSHARWLAAVAAAVAVAGSISCGPRVDVKQALQVTEVTTGWFDAGIVDGKNKLVPSIAFKQLKNAAAQQVGSVQLNIIFVVPPDWEDDTYLRGIGSSGLPPGQASDRFVVRAKHGYTGEQPRAGDAAEQPVPGCASASRSSTPPTSGCSSLNSVERQLLTN